MELLMKGLGIKSFDIIYSDKTIYDIFIEITAISFLNINIIDYTALSSLGGRGVIITTLGGKHNQLNINEYLNEIETQKQGKSIFDNRFDFVSRFFAPLCGIPEDPVTGSAHCSLAPYWSQKLNLNSNNIMIAYQASFRGGILQLQVIDNRVILTGKCVTTIKSKVCV